MSDLREIRKKVRSLVLTEADKMRAAGAGDADIQEDAFTEMVGQKIAEQTFSELTPDDLKAIWQNLIENRITTSSTRYRQRSACKRRIRWRLRSGVSSRSPRAGRRMKAKEFVPTKWQRRKLIPHGSPRFRNRRRSSLNH